ncbi:shikimate kinase [bacterium]|nr:shikimate kinase [bacterium]
MRRQKHPNNVVLIGMPGSGKTTVGVNLSRRIHKKFIDTDRLLSKQFGLKISEIFAAHGEAAFRDAEADLCESLLTCRHSVISTGGGIIIRASNRTMLRSIGKVVYLAPTFDTLWARLKHDKHRPLLQTESPEATLKALFEQRDPMYRDCAHRIIHILNQTPFQVAELIDRDLLMT